MPGEAIALDAARHVLSPDGIVTHVNRLVVKPLSAVLQP
jgi:hypothetical protein